MTSYSQRASSLKRGENKALSIACVLDPRTKDLDEIEEKYKDQFYKWVLEEGKVIEDRLNAEEAARYMLAYSSSQAA